MGRRRGQPIGMLFDCCWCCCCCDGEKVCIYTAGPAEHLTFKVLSNEPEEWWDRRKKSSEAKVRRCESKSRRRREEGCTLLFRPEHSDAYLTRMLILSEHFSPTKALCEEERFAHLHKNICLIRLMAFVAYMCERVWRGGVSVSQMEGVGTIKPHRWVVGM